MGYSDFAVSLFDNWTGCFCIILSVFEFQQQEAHFPYWLLFVLLFSCFYGLGEIAISGESGG